MSKIPRLPIFLGATVTLIIAAATVPLVRNWIGANLTTKEINHLAEKITVHITNGDSNGSGVIVDKQEDLYTVLTNCHVVKTADNYTIQTYDGRGYSFSSQHQCHNEIDLALVYFRSNEKYPLAKLGDSALLEEGENISVSGWRAKSRNNPKPSYRFYQGAVAGSQPGARKGYHLVHTAKSLPGMSGGSILNPAGQLVGIDSYIDREPNSGEKEFFAIPINVYKRWIDREPNSDEKEFLAILINIYKRWKEPVRLSDYSLAYAIGGHSRGVHRIAITPDGELLASTNGDTIKIWNLTTGRLEKTLEGHSDSVESIAITPDGRQLISGSYDKTIKIWNLRTGRLEKTLEGHSDDVESLAISPDRSTIVSGDRDAERNLAIDTKIISETRHDG